MHAQIDYWQTYEEPEKTVQTEQKVQTNAHNCFNEFQEIRK